MVSATESPVHQNWKDAIIAAEATDTVFLNQFSKPALRALRTERATHYERTLLPGYDGPPVMAEFQNTQKLYFGGDMEASLALSGQVAGRIESVRPVGEIISQMVEEFSATLGNLAARYC